MSPHPVAIARRAARKVRAETHRMHGHSHHLYVALLDFSDIGDGEVGFYVGESRYRPERRLAQHLAGIRASGIVRRRGVRILDRLTKHLNPLSRAEAKRLEPILAAALKDVGLRVHGGH